jgi:hypothetical protein
MRRRWGLAGRPCPSGRFHEVGSRGAWWVRQSGCFRRKLPSSNKETGGLICLLMGIRFGASVCILTKPPSVASVLKYSKTRIRMEHWGPESLNDQPYRMGLGNLPEFLNDQPDRKGLGNFLYFHLVSFLGRRNTGYRIILNLYNTWNYFIAQWICYDSAISMVTHGSCVIYQTA